MEIELLYKALASPIGIVLSTSDTKLAIQRFYTARRKLTDEALEVLQIRQSPFEPETEIWIVKLKSKQI